MVASWRQIATCPYQARFQMDGPRHSPSANIEWAFRDRSEPNCWMLGTEGWTRFFKRLSSSDRQLELMPCRMSEEKKKELLRAQETKLEQCVCDSFRHQNLKGRRLAVKMEALEGQLPGDKPRQCFDSPASGSTKQTGEKGITDAELPSFEAKKNTNQPESPPNTSITSTHSRKSRPPWSNS